MEEKIEIPEDMLRINGPKIGFVGAISSYKLDFYLIRSLALTRPDWSFVFIGEVGEGDPLTDISLFRDFPNVYLMGGRPYSTLPSYLKGIDVAILPNTQNQYTRSMFPMKFFEYLSAGKPIVSVDLPALADYRSLVYLCSGHEEFESAIAATLEGRHSPLEVRLAVAQEHTYERRTRKMFDVLEKAERLAEG